ncbi:MAG: DUF6029 family protein [Ignavibacteria bacterium]|nr:DUF6029 family protein [Ignavibacteria bacterium]
MKKILLITLFLFIAAGANAQIKLNVKAALNNVFRYGSGSETNLGQTYGKEYFENISDARLSVNDIVFGMRYEIDRPIEYGNDFLGIKKRYVEYTNDEVGINLRAGDFWEIVGRGLSMNVFEDRFLYYDTGIDGIRASYKKTFGQKYPVKVKGMILGGRMTFNDYLVPTRVETYDVRSGNFEIAPAKFMILGGNYVYSTGSIPTSIDTTAIKSYVPEAYGWLKFKDFQWFLSYAHKQTNTTPNTIYPDAMFAKGDGFYSSLSYSMPKIGFTFDYKNYRFDLTSPDNRGNDRPTRMLPYQNPPTAIKEQATTLLSRYPHVVDFNDEVGAQFDVIYAPNDKMTFNFNSAIASRHYNYENIGVGALVEYQRVDRNDDFLPNLNDEFSPWYEFYAEGEYYVTDDFYGKVAYDYQNSVIYDYLSPENSEKQWMHTIPTEFRYTFIPEYTFKLSFEQQFLYNSNAATDKNFMNQLIALSLSKSPELSATIGYEWTTSNDEPTGKTSWLLGEVSYKINPTNTVTVSYGTERGGVRCTNGICRYVRPFEGFRLTINSKF